MPYNKNIHEELMNVNLEVKGNVAKLLATENLVVEHKNCETASFDVDNRVLTLPNWNKASNQVFDLLVAHEVGHALFTPNGEWDERAPHDFINVCEDPRIEKLMKRKYAGLRKTFYNGYSELDQQDFFEVDKIDLDELNLADRINLHFKCGNYRDIPFTEEEFPIVEMVDDAETFEDVLTAAEVLYKYCKKEFDDKKKADQEEEQSEAPSSLTEPITGGGKSKESHPFFDEEGEENDGKGEGQEELREEGSQETKNPDKELLDELMDQLMDNSGGSDKPEVSTQKSAESRMRDLTSGNDYYENSYIELPKMEYDDVVYGHDLVQEELGEHYNTIKNDEDWLLKAREGIKQSILEAPDKELRAFLKSSAKEVNYLVKEFEMKKSADAYARANVSKTGVLDCTKLHTYKHSEDIFKKITTLPDGKNHGLVFVLDWSGSMSHILHDTVKQLINLVSFCRKVKIPFEVYAFINHFYEGETSHNYYSAEKKWLHERKENLFVVPSNFRFLNFISSQGKKKDIDIQIKNLWRLSYQYQYRGGIAPPHKYALGGTPLNESVISLHTILPYFKKNNDLQKVHTIILTDGEAAGISKSRKYTGDYAGYHEDGIGTSSVDYNTYIRNRKTGRTYHCNGHYGVTSALLTNLGHSFPQVNVIGIRLCSNREFGSALRGYVDYDNREKVQKEWRRNGSVSLKGNGYDSLFAISCKSLDNDVEFEVNEDATKAQIRSAFKKTLKSKSMNKKILSEFVDLVA